MPPSLEERRPAITPQLALRVAMLGGFAFVLFGVVFFRLWFLQVLTGEDYVSQARENRVRKVRIEAPRGDIVDRNGRTLVRTRVAPGRAGRAEPAARVRARAGRRLPRRRARRSRASGCRPPRACAALDRELGEDGRRDAEGRSAASAAGWPARRASARARRRAAAAGGRRRRARALPPARPRDRRQPAHDPPSA